MADENEPIQTKTSELPSPPDDLSALKAENEALKAALAQKPPQMAQVVGAPQPGLNLSNLLQLLPLLEDKDPIASAVSQAITKGFAGNLTTAIASSIEISVNPQKFASSLNKAQPAETQTEVIDRTQEYE